LVLGLNAPFGFGMKLGGIVILVVFVTNSSAWAQIGPPQPRAPSLGYSLGVGIQNVQSEWTYDYTVARNRIYLEGAHGLSDWCELFSRIGGSNFVINDIDSFQPSMTRDVSSDGYPAFWSGGLRGKTWENEAWSIGVSLEVAVYSGMDETIRWTYNTYQELHFDPTVEINAGISLGYKLANGMLYGGPLLHFGYSSADVRTHVFGPDWSIQDSIDAVTIRDKPGWGCFVGWQRPIGDDGWNLQLEGSALNGGFGGAISCFKAW
jgi:hypothetical protein